MGSMGSADSGSVELGSMEFGSILSPPPPTSLTMCGDGVCTAELEDYVSCNEDCATPQLPSTSIRFDLTFNVDAPEDIAAKVVMASAIQNETVTLLQVDEERVDVLSLVAGSVVATMDMHASADGSGLSVADMLAAFVIAATRPAVHSGLLDDLLNGLLLVLGGEVQTIGATERNRQRRRTRRPGRCSSR